MSLPSAETQPEIALRHEPEAPSPRRRVGRLRPTQLALVLLITLVAATCFIAIRAAGPAVPPLRFAAWRLLLGGAVLVPLLRPLGEPWLPPRRLWPQLVLLALTASAFGYGAMFASPGLAGAGLASVLGNTQPLLVLALAPWLLHEHMKPRTWLALALGVAGIAFVTAPSLTGPDALHLGQGAALALASSAGLAFGTIIVKRLEPGTPLLTLTAWQLLLGALPLFALSALTETGTPVLWTPRFLALLLYLALAGTAFLTVAWYRLLTDHEAGRLSLFFFLVPAFGLALAAALLGERVTPPQVLGATLIVASAAAAAWPQTHAPRPSLPELAANRARETTQGVGTMTHHPDHHNHDASVIDPVCGMVIDPNTTELRSDYQGTTYYFCGPGCQQAFDADPEKYAQAGHGSHGDGDESTHHH